MKGICLVSGGLDSSLTLLELNKRGLEVQPLFVDYNQWSSSMEENAVKRLCKWGNFTEPVIIRSFVEGENQMDVGSVWGRGIALVGLVAMWAYTHSNDYVFIAVGNHKGDVGPDCKPGLFDSSLNETLQDATKGQLELVLPIRELTTAGVGLELAKLGVPFDILYSCYWSPPCGYKSEHETYRCPGCRRKKIAMEAAGVTDKEFLDFPNGNKLGRSYQSTLAEKLTY